MAGQRQLHAAAGDPDRKDAPPAAAGEPDGLRQGAVAGPDAPLSGSAKAKKIAAGKNHPNRGTRSQGKVDGERGRRILRLRRYGRPFEGRAIGKWTRRDLVKAGLAASAGAMAGGELVAEPREPRLAGAATA